MYIIYRLNFYRQLLEELMLPYCPDLLSVNCVIYCYCYILGKKMMMIKTKGKKGKGTVSR